MTNPNETPVQREARLRRHRHNALLGNIKVAEKLLYAVAKSDTVHVPTRTQLATILNELRDCYEQVYNYRVEPDGTVTQVKHEGEAQLDKLAKRTKRSRPSYGIFSQS